ncbi:cation transporter [Corticibacter populi]|uniref:Cation transporter n=1 Tax=Corticibacter populi TaxID=1550736 RepID=A0A3M6QY12_9BURK|nr:cation diffusion facilitator family transporter [Corticibacter populi]RMX07907.1 cation transporter [Corticibacter populi]RZS35146.1 cation diffusion facilitator family transporter [Corticibacter populi]
MHAPALTRYAWLSVAAALLTIGLKTWAWWLTGSVGLLSDAMESGVNLAGALMALWMLSIAARPADEDHAFGHGKAEYFSSGFEGFLIMAAAGGIVYAAAQRLLAPQALQALGPGLLVSVLASLVNLAVGLVLLRAARKHHSITLEADGRHLLTDVWTSAGVALGLLAAWATGWWWLDPLLALGVALNIVWTGFQLVRRSAGGLMDETLPDEDLQAIEAVLSRYRAQGIDFHALRTRQAGMRAFASVHVLVPGDWTVQHGHDLVERVEAELQQALPRLHITTHLEPAEDPRSHADQGLDRPGDRH